MRDPVRPEMAHPCLRGGVEAGRDALPPREEKPPRLRGAGGGEDALLPARGPPVSSPRLHDEGGIGSRPEGGAPPPARQAGRGMCHRTSRGGTGE